jgi:hypothetical protein
MSSVLMKHMSSLVLAALGLATSAIAQTNTPPDLFDPRALVKPITEMEGVLSDGSKSTVYKIVVRSLPTDHETGPWAPMTITNTGGFWEDIVEKKLYRVDGDYLAKLNRRGWDMFDPDGTVHRTKTRAEFDKVARAELGGWSFEQAKSNGVVNSVIELLPSAQIVTIFLPKDPKASAQLTRLRQARFSPRSGVGLSLNGVRFFPPEPLDRITAFQNIAPIDPHGGHTGFGHEYHYHRAPSVMAEDKSGKIVGFALDGFAIRGPTTTTSATNGPSSSAVSRARSAPPPLATWMSAMRPNKAAALQAKPRANPEEANGRVRPTVAHLRRDAEGRPQEHHEAYSRHAALVGHLGIDHDRIRPSPAKRPHSPRGRPRLERRRLPLVERAHAQSQPFRQGRHRAPTLLHLSRL